MKAIKFLDFMVKAVFISTFVFTAVAIFISYKLLWEQVMITLVERWFTVMVGELIVMGFIQIVKTIVQAKLDKEEDDKQ